VISSPDSSAEEVAQLIMVDAPLAASTLRLANSAYFGSGSKVATLQEAVFRLGQRELFQLATLAMVSRWESGANAQGGPGDFCRHALCTGIAAEEHAETSGRVEAQVAYAAGLVCDLGKLALWHSCAALFPALRTRCTETGCSWVSAERAVLGYTHAEVGGRLLRAWNFPALLVAAAEYCERPAKGPADARPLLVHLHAAKFVATSFGPGAPDEGFLFELDSALLIEWGFTPEKLEAAMVVVHDRAKARLQDKLSHGALTF
jgi:HD-like signal output (HDOD) protein